MKSAKSNQIEDMLWSLLQGRLYLKCVS